MVHARGGARGQNLGHLNFFFFFVMESLVFEQQILFRVDPLCNLRPSLQPATLGFSAHGVGQGVKI